MKKNELKRYVLLNDNTILDVSTEIYYLRGENELYRDRPNACVVTVKIGYIKKTSDNILDLVEVGDLVEDEHLKTAKYSLPIVHTVLENDILSTALKAYNTHSLHNVIKENVKAIYKLQLNGDYKRYELKENEKWQLERMKPIAKT